VFIYSSTAVEAVFKITSKENGANAYPSPL